MKKILFLLPVCIFLFSIRVFSQTVYVNQTGNCYHTNKCQLYTKNFEAVPLWKAMNAYGKKPCPKCHPPTKETKGGKKTGTKPKKATAHPVKTPAPAKKKGT